MNIPICVLQSVVRPLLHEDGISNCAGVSRLWNVGMEGGVRWRDDVYTVHVTPATGEVLIVNLETKHSFKTLHTYINSGMSKMSILDLTILLDPVSNTQYSDVYYTLKDLLKGFTHTLNVYGIRSHKSHTDKWVPYILFNALKMCRVRLYSSIFTMGKQEASTIDGRIWSSVHNEQYASHRIEYAMAPDGDVVLGQVTTVLRTRIPTTCSHVDIVDIHKVDTGLSHIQVFGCLDRFLTNRPYPYFGSPVAIRSETIQYHLVSSDLPFWATLTPSHPPQDATHILQPESLPTTTTTEAITTSST